MTFVDSNVWFALYLGSDPNHIAATGWLTANNGRLITTDYVIDETLTLMRARGQNRKAVEFGTLVFAGNLAVVHYLTPAEIASAWDVFRTYADKGWSFTDCTSKVVMETLGITTAFSFDQHFHQFGTIAVVP